MLGIIAGSGWSSADWLHDVSSSTVETAYGSPSSALHIGYHRAAAKLAAGVGKQTQRVCFLARHGSGHVLPPHKINYRANVQAMLEAGVEGIVSINSVGSCRAAWQPGSLVVPDQIIDYSYGRQHTFFDTLQDFSAHVDFTEPFCASLRHKLLLAAEQAGLPVQATATYGCTQGPRLETAAEIRRLQRDGCDLVGMTLMPEAALCRERNLPSASICLLVNPAAGVSEQPLAAAAIEQAIVVGSVSVHKLIEQLVQLQQ